MGSFVSSIKEVERLEHISAVLIKYELGYVLTKLGLRSGHHRRKELQPHILVKICEELGGTFIKLGQFLSLRPDLIPHEYCEALSALQDAVPPFPSVKAKHIIAEDLGERLADIFSYIDPKPIAAASIGQVYKAKLKTGQYVAVKVMRPGVKEQMLTDTLLLFRLASLVHHHFKPKVFDPMRIVEEFRKYTENELNYLTEMQALRTCAENFKAVPHVRIPQVYDRWCSERVLTMEFLDGAILREQMASLPQKRRRDLAEHLTHIVLKQIFIDGFFHADLHPGNILLLEKGQIGLIDFGIMGFLDESTREYLMILMLSLVHKDVEGVVKMMGKLHFFEDPDEAMRLKEDLALTLGPYYGASLKHIDIAELFLRCLHIARENGLEVPSNLVLLGKTIVTLKGLLEELDPDFDMLTVVKPFMSELLQRQTSLKGIVEKASKEVIQLKSFITDLPKMTSDYFEAATRVERDLRHIGYQIEVFSKDVTLMLRQLILMVIIFVFVMLAVVLWTRGPFVFGFSLLSVGFGVASLLLLAVFVRSFSKVIL